MGGLVAGTTRAPITAIIIVFELTNDYNIILPLMITCIISVILSAKLSRESIYTLKLLMRNERQYRRLYCCQFFNEANWRPRHATFASNPRRNLGTPI